MLPSRSAVRLRTPFGIVPALVIAGALAGCDAGNDTMTTAPVDAPEVRDATPDRDAFDPSPVTPVGEVSPSPTPGAEPATPPPGGTTEPSPTPSSEPSDETTRPGDSPGTQIPDEPAKAGAGDDPPKG